MKRKFLISVWIVAVFMLTACGKTKVEEKIVELSASTLWEPQTTEVIRGDLQVSVAYDALVGPKVVQLSFEEEGVFGEYKVQLGEEVKEGDILAVSDVESMENLIEDKERELEDLTVTFDYKKATFDNQLKLIDIQLEELYRKRSEVANVPSAYQSVSETIRQTEEHRRRVELQIEQLK